MKKNSESQKVNNLAILIITIIILLILAGITINLLTEKRLLEKTKFDKQQATETESNDIEFSYKVASYENNKFEILIKIADENNGIDTIHLPDGIIRMGNGKKEVGIDYEVDEGVNYIIIARNTKGIEKEETINLIKPIEPTIQDVEIGYPIFTSTGVKVPDGQKVEINYDEREEFLNYYSFDNGETWKLYTEPITITSKELKAKSVNKKFPEIYTEVNKVMNVPADALGNICYDGKTDRFQDGFSYVGNNGGIQRLICYVDSSTWGCDYKAYVGKRVYAWRDLPIYFYNSEWELLGGTSQSCVDTGMHLLEGKVPEGAEIAMFFSDLYLNVYEFEIIK